MGFLENAASWLDTTLKASDGVSVVFWRGAASVTLDAVIGMTEFVTEDHQGTLVSWQSRDFIVTSADLILGGDHVEPEAGSDYIEMPISGRTCKFQVTAPKGQKCFRYCDPESRTSMRIHTKQISNEASE